MPKKVWRILPQDEGQARQYGKAVGVPPVVAQLLLGRGLRDSANAREFLDAPLTGLRLPEDLPGASAAADRLHAAIRDKRRICVYGDYDVDGMAGTSLLYSALKLLGGDVRYHIPSRLDDGYGLHSETLRRLHREGSAVVVSVDCGITAVAEAEVAKEIGLELIVTDHHTVSATLPDAAALVHPGLPGTAYPFLGLCGAGVALKLAWAVCKQAGNAVRVSPAMREHLLQAVGFAALGTVADVVPLIDENRILVRHGLVSLRERPTPGMRQLLKVCKLAEDRPLSAEDLAFAVAPRFNAAGRFGQAVLGVELMTTLDPERATSLADYINELNGSRQTLERSIYLAALKQAQEEFDPVHDPALVLAGRGWHVGVIGIVAGKLAEKFHRPVVLLALDEGDKPAVGSARSVAGLNLHAALDGCREHLIRFGGHAMAAGLSIEEGRLDAFRADFLERVSLARTDGTGAPELVLDGEAPLAAFTREVVEQCERLAPFGSGNHRPLWCTTGVTLADPPKKMGGGERHLSLRVRQGGTFMRAVAFGGADWADEMNGVGGLLDLAFRPVLNHFRGMTNVELHLVDWRPSAAPTPAVR